MPWDFWLIFLFLGVVIPWRGHVRLRRLMEKSTVDTKEKLSLYGLTIVFQWAAVGVVTWRALARGLTQAQLGLASQGRSQIILVSLLGAVLLGGFHWLRLWKAGKLEGPAPDFMRKLAGLILPTTLVELFPYFALAVTAGVCEEFLYRGFVMGAFARVGMAKWAVVIVSSILFGLAHAYQGRGGILSTFVMGILFAVTRLGYDSLLPVMVWHATVDVVAGIAGPKYLLRRAKP
jgi:uncharacterized protein